MGFKAAKAAVAKALREGNFQNEAREALAEKNLLAVGAIEPGAVAKLVQRTMAVDYNESPHHWDRSVTVHTFKPRLDDERWYIKAYFLDLATGTATFISVHRAG